MEDAFDRELQSFDVDAELAKRVQRSEEQAEEFRNRFPLVRLKYLSQHEFCSEDGNKDDFCHWITEHTRDVAQYCAWDKIRFFGFSSQRGFGWENRIRGRRIPNRWDDSYIENYIVLPLVRILEAPFHESFHTVCLKEWFRHDFDVATRAFGRPLLLKIFLLYHPDTFINITRLEWLKRIALSFSLPQGESVLETNHHIFDFYKLKSKRVRLLPPVVFVEVLDRFLWLTSQGDEEFRSYLLDVKGYPPNAVAEICRLLRETSKHAVSRRISLRPLPKVTDPGVLEFVRDNLSRDDEWLAHCREKGKSSRYWRALQLLIEFRQSNRVVKRGAHECPSRNVKLEEPVQAKSVLSRLKRAETVSDLVGELCELGQMHDGYHHYTTLSSFLAIAGSSSLRLTRGDDPVVNDQWECLSCGNPSLWHRTFIRGFVHKCGCVGG